MNPTGANIPAGGKYVLSGSWTSRSIVEGCLQYEASADNGGLVVSDKDGQNVLSVESLKAGSIVRFCGTMVHVTPK